jgi:hypothetical protein
MLPTTLQRRLPASAIGRAVLRIALVVGVAGCGLTASPPAPTPADFQGLAGDLVKRGLRIDHIVSGDAGCDDLTLKQTAIGLDAVGLDQATPTRLFIYIFRNRASYERLRQTVDACASSYAADPETFESIEASPFVVASSGPWAPEFKSAVRAAITEAAGTGD